VPANGPLSDVTAPDTVPARDAAGPGAKSEAVKNEAKPEAEASGPQPMVAEPRASSPKTKRRASRQPNRPVAVELRRHGDGLRLFFPFAEKTPAAVFQRADTLWLVFDTAAPIDVDPLNNDPSQTIRSADISREGDAQVVRLRLERPRLASVDAEEGGWSVSLGDAMQNVVKPLAIARNIVTAGRTSLSIPFEKPHKAHWLADPDIGDKLLVVTGLGPSRGLLRSQDFVDLRAIASAHGIAVQPYADDVQAELSVDKVLLARPGGLTLSEADPPKTQRVARALTFDTSAWSVNRSADYIPRQFELIRAAAQSSFVQRTAHRVDLARFYFSRQMFAEAKSVLDTAIADERPTAANPTPLVLRAIANIMLGRFDAALKDLNDPAVGNQNDAQIWRALVASRQGRWAEAREAFRYVEAALGSLPLELQQVALRDALRASIEVGDFDGAAKRLNDFQVIGVSPDIEPFVTVLTGRLAEASGRAHDALAAYRTAAASEQRPAAAAAKLRELSLRYAMGDIKKDELINELEMLTTSWRGDETEVEALLKLARLYTGESRYRDAFTVMRVSMRAHPTSDVTRTMQDEASKTFDNLFLSGKGDALPAIEALSLFYDYRELTPIGRRGDEMIRKLAERLVTVDLLDQASELLQYQVDNRLQGVARAGRDPPRGDLSAQPQARPGAGRAAGDPHRRSRQRNPHPAAANRGARLVRQRTARLCARGRRGHRGPRVAAAALRHLLGGAPLAAGRRAHRAPLRGSLEELRTAVRRRAPGHPARRRGLCDGRGQAWRRPPARQVRGQDGRRPRPPRVRSDHRRARAEQPRIPRGGAHRRIRRHACRLPARPQGALSGVAGYVVGWGGPAARGGCGAAACGEGRRCPDRIDSAARTCATSDVALN
jgi:tetratricopeptide (TPR) repeat protein